MIYPLEGESRRSYLDRYIHFYFHLNRGVREAYICEGRKVLPAEEFVNRLHDLAEKAADKFF